MNAVLDGIDPGSDVPHERMKFAVYQRRLLLAALRDKAMLLAMMGNSEKASAVAEAYIEAAVPMTKHAEVSRKLDMEEQLRQIESMGPIRARPVLDVPPI